MGNSCLCENIRFIRDIKLNSCFQKQDINNKSVQIEIKEEYKIDTNDKQNKENNDKDKNKSYINKMNELLNYFNEGEKEIINNFKKKEKVKKIPGKRLKEKTIIVNKDDNKYELMLKRLLEQQNIKKEGPKRRETIRKGEEDKIKEIVKNILKENKNNIINQKTKNENNSLLIKKQFNKKGRYSVSFDRNMIFMNKLINNNNKKKFSENYFKNRNTFNNELNSESNNGNVLHKQTTKESIDK